VTRAAFAAIVLAGCGGLTGFGGEVPPLATVQVVTTGTTTEQPAHLQVALVWGAQWLIEPLCILPPESDEVAAVLVRGCRDPFGFVPDRVGANNAIEPGIVTELPLFELPATDVLVGDLTARVAYASVVVYDDRDVDGTLDLTRASRPDDGGLAGDMPPVSTDLVYGASFSSMTTPDQRLAFREGAFNSSAAFYPRAGCGAPPPGFAIVTAGGFSASEAIAASLRGELPREDPATCTEVKPEVATITVSLSSTPPAAVRETACTERLVDSSTRYREPPAAPLDLTDRAFACANIPDFGTGRATGIIQLIVSSRTDDRCRGLTHFVLRGCADDPTCAEPAWDHSATPPSWWPCPAP
jgi:hypothetical protein